MLLTMHNIIKMTLLRCGSGLSGEQLTEEGHHWIGVEVFQFFNGFVMLTRRNTVFQKDYTIFSRLCMLAWYVSQMYILYIVKNSLTGKGCQNSSTVLSRESSTGD